MGMKARLSWPLMRDQKDVGERGRCGPGGIVEEGKSDAGVMLFL